MNQEALRQEPLSTEPGAALLEALTAALAADRIVVEQAERDFFSQDVYERGVPPLAVLRPRNSDEVQRIVGLAREHGTPLYVRGGGMSYTRAYLPAESGALLIDSSGLDQVHEINVEDGYVTVGAGVTWKALDAALSPHGVRTRFWGPFSGGRATVGGSFSQGSATFGSGQTGTTAPAALGFEVVTGTGDRLQTGMNAQPHHVPFFRGYGPDMTGLFTHDAGALGIKTAVTLALEERPPAYGGVSFAFDDFDSMFAAMRDAARTGQASEIIGMDAEIAGIQAGERGLRADLRKLWTVVSGAHSLRRGIARGAHAVLAGRRAFGEARFTAHFIADARSNRLLDARLAELEDAGRRHGATIPNAAVGMIRAQPFPELPLTHMDGRRMLPIHGILPNSRVLEFRREYLAYVDSVRERMDRCRVTLVETFAGLGLNGFLYEPVWYWEDSLQEFHERVSPEAMISAIPRYEENLPGRELVEEMKNAIIDIMFRYGAAHLQIGRVYPYQREREASAGHLLREAKAALDPDGLINPGCLGL